MQEICRCLVLIISLCLYLGLRIRYGEAEYRMSEWRDGNDYCVMKIFHLQNVCMREVLFYF